MFVFLIITHEPLERFSSNILLKISQIPRNLEISPNAYRYFRVVYFKDFGNFSNDLIFGKFPKNADIWEISQIPRHLGSSPDTQAFGKFPKLL